MIGEAAFHLLKTEGGDTESAKQAEIRLRLLGTILTILTSVAAKHQEIPALVVAAPTSAGYG
jgi:hypothetical protein